MILVITDWFPVYDRYGYKTGEKEFSTNYGIDLETGRTVVLPEEHPRKLGAIFNNELNEWVIHDTQSIKTRKLDEISRDI